MFAYPPSDGYLPTNNWHGYDKLTDGQEIIFFCRVNDYETKIRGLSVPYPVINGKIVYGSSGLLGGELYSADGFKRVIIGYSNTNARGAVFGGAAAAWLRESAHRERFRYVALISPLEVPPESAHVRGADGPENGDSNRPAVIVLSRLRSWSVGSSTDHFIAACCAGFDLARDPHRLALAILFTISG